MKGLRTAIMSEVMALTLYHNERRTAPRVRVGGAVFETMIPRDDGDEEVSRKIH